MRSLFVISCSVVLALGSIGCGSAPEPASDRPLASTGGGEARRPADDGPEWRAIGGTGVRLRGLEDFVPVVGMPALTHEATGTRVIALEAESGLDAAFVDGMLDGMPAFTPRAREDRMIDGRQGTVVHGSDQRGEGIIVAVGSNTRVAAVVALWPFGTDPAWAARMEQIVLGVRWSETPVVGNIASPIALGPPGAGWEPIEITGGMPAFQIPSEGVHAIAIAFSHPGAASLVADTCRGSLPDLGAFTQLESIRSFTPESIGGMPACEVLGAFVATSGAPTGAYRLVVAMGELLVIISADTPLASGDRWLESIRELARTVHRAR